MATDVGSLVPTPAGPFGALVLSRARDEDDTASAAPASRDHVKVLHQQERQRDANHPQEFQHPNSDAKSGSKKPGPPESLNFPAAPGPGGAIVLSLTRDQDVTSAPAGPSHDHVCSTNDLLP